MISTIIIMMVLTSPTPLPTASITPFPLPDLLVIAMLLSLQRKKITTYLYLQEVMISDVNFTIPHII